MASPGVGYKTACDVLMEISYHLIEQVVDTTITEIGPGGYSDGYYSGPPNYSDSYGYYLKLASYTGIYVGAQIVVGWGTPNAEVGTVEQVSSADGSIIIQLNNSHSVGDIVLAPTFPTQQPTDPLFTQLEMLGYLSRAQNEFLAMCPVSYDLAYQNLSYGQIFQDTPSNCIEINRVASSTYSFPILTLTRSNNVVTAVTDGNHGLGVGSTIYIQNTTLGFGGVFQIASVPSPSSFTYAQFAADGAAAGGKILYFQRIYETTQAEITMSNRNWRNDYIESPDAFFEDRAGLYRWGVNGRPSSNFAVELLMSIRDTDTLGLLDGFLVPDTLVYLVKYKALSYAFSKDGVQADPTRATYCDQRFQKGCAAVNRYLESMSMEQQAVG